MKIENGLWKYSGNNPIKKQPEHSPRAKTGTGDATQLWGPRFNSKMPAPSFLDEQESVKSHQMALHSVNLSRVPTPWMTYKWRSNSLKKVVKTNKSQTTRANQQQHREKNDFYAWKVPLSPLAST
ncbi:hypothetical protein [Limnohabitans sp.]|jgi:hypothetical protein|uniref:hypothetical protein n=1 Tax=Limnohabitans sp. TaxID=1907725 RepID=UPI0037BE3F40